VLRPAELEALADERTAWLAQWLKPADDLEKLWVSEMGMASAQMTRSHKILLVDLQRLIDSAGPTWETHRREYVEQLSLRLSKDPQRIAQALRKSKQGAEILLKTWAELEGILQTAGTWTEGQRHQAFDLLGIPRVLREGNRRLPPDADAAVMAELVRTEMARLRKRIAGPLADRDDDDRLDAGAGFTCEEDPESRRHRRGYEEAKRSFYRHYAMLKEVRASKAQNEAASAPEPAPKPKPRKPIPPRPVASEAAVASLAERWYPEKPFGRLPVQTPPRDPAEYVFDNLPQPIDEMPPAAVPAPTPPPGPAQRAAPPQPVAAKPKGPQPPARPAKTPQQAQKEREDEARHEKRQQEKKARKAARRHRKR
jgi:hypothetical protein